MPVCFPCGLKLPSISALHTHFKDSHNLQPKEDFGFRCAEGGGCYATYSGWKSFRVHLLKNHNCPQLSTPLLEEDSTNESSGSALPNQLISTDEPPQQKGHSTPHDKESLNIPRIFDDMVIEFAAKLYANHKLPRSHVVDVMKATTDLLGSMLELLIPEVKEIISTCEKEEASSKVETQLYHLVSPFKNLSTEYLYLKVLKARDFFISLHTYSIGARVRIKRKKGMNQRVLSNVTAKFIPMRVVLKKVFSLPGVYSAVSSYVTELGTREDWLENFVQGNLWKSKVNNHFQGKEVYPIFMYFDDFEVNNPLGSHAGVHKLGGVYYSIPCFPPEVQSLLHNVFVAALFYSGDRVDFANDATFSEGIKELNFLQSEGILIDTDNGTKRIHFALGLVLGDNLGLNQILGFQEGFNAIYSCRFCKTSKFARQWETEENHFRSRESYGEDVGQNDAKCTGVREKSVWDKVEYFETCTNFAVDYLHDGPEGAFKKFMGLIVHYFSISRKCSQAGSFLRILNDRLQCFDCYNNAVSNRPPVITYDEAKDKQLKMSASEMQNFTLMFAMLVGDIVPLDDEVWQFYLIMRKVLDIVLAPRLKKGYVPLLKVYVGEMYSMFLSVFPHETVPHKLHIWVHYFRVLAESGPLTHLSTFRFESKHRDKKTEASATTSRVDITQTLCHKELHCLAYRFILGKGFAPNNKVGKGVKIFNISNVQGYSSFQSSCPLSFCKDSQRLTWATVGGHTYRKGSCVVMRLEGTSEVNPIFGVVDTVLKNASGDILLICKTLFTLGFANDYHAYEVEESNDYECITVSQLLTPFLAMYGRLSENLHVTLRHAL